MDWIKKSASEVTAWILIIFSGAILRLYPLLTRSFWEDELWNYHFSTSLKSIGEQLMHPMDDRPPLYFLFVKFLASINSSEIFLRLPSFIAGILTILIVGLAIRKYSKYLALLTVFFLSFSIFLIDNSWQLRDYGILVFVVALIISKIITILSDIVSHKNLSKKDFLVLSLLFVMCTLLNHLSIPFIVCVIVALIIVISVMKVTVNKPTIFGGFILSAIPALCIATFFLSIQFTKIKSTTSWIPYPTSISYLSLNSGLLGLTSDFSEQIETSSELLKIYLLINLVLAVSLFLYVKITKDVHPTSPFYLLRLFTLVALLVYTLNVISVVVLSSVLGTSLFLPRTFLASGLFLITGFAIAVGIFIKKSTYQTKIAFVTLTVTVLFGSIFLYQYDSLFGKTSGSYSQEQNINMMLKFVDETYIEGDQIVMIPDHYNLLYLPYYWRKYPDRK